MTDWEIHLDAFLTAAKTDDLEAVDFYAVQWHRAELWGDDMPDPIACAQDYVQENLHGGGENAR